jgi:dihydrofolate reductase
MTAQKLRVLSFGISLDGYSAGPNQSLDHPLGVGGTGLMEWFFPTRTFQRMHNPESRDAVGLANVPEQLFGQENGGAGIDNDFAARGFENVGAWIIGRNMFGPVRGAWADEEWKGWWGAIPPFIAMCLCSRITPERRSLWRRHHVPFRHRWNRSRMATREGRSQWQGRTARRRSRHGSSLPAGWLG